MHCESVGLGVEEKDALVHVEGLNVGEVETLAEPHSVAKVEGEGLSEAEGDPLNDKLALSQKLPLPVREVLGVPDRVLVGVREGQGEELTETEKLWEFEGVTEALEVGVAGLVEARALSENVVVEQTVGLTEVLWEEEKDTDTEVVVEIAAERVGGAEPERVTVGLSVPVREGDNEEEPLKVRLAEEVRDSEADAHREGKGECEGVLLPQRLPVPLGVLDPLCNGVVLLQAVHELHSEGEGVGDREGDALKEAVPVTLAQGVEVWQGEGVVDCVGEVEWERVRDPEVEGVPLMDSKGEELKLKLVEEQMEGVPVELEVPHTVRVPQKETDGEIDKVAEFEKEALGEDDRVVHWELVEEMQLLGV